MKRFGLSALRVSLGLPQLFGWLRHRLCAALRSSEGMTSHTGTTCGGRYAPGQIPFIYMIIMWHAASKTRPSTHVWSSHASTGIGAFHALPPTSFLETQRKSKEFMFIVARPHSWTHGSTTFGTGGCQHVIFFVFQMIVFRIPHNTQWPHLRKWLPLAI